MVSMILPGLMENNDAELQLLEAVETNPLVMAVDANFQDPKTQMAFQQCLLNNWIKLLDVALAVPGPGQPPTLARVFGKTQEGHQRYMFLKNKSGMDSVLKNGIG